MNCRWLWLRIFSSDFILHYTEFHYLLATSLLHLYNMLTILRLVGRGISPLSHRSLMSHQERYDSKQTVLRLTSSSNPDIFSFWNSSHFSESKGSRGIYGVLRTQVALKSRWLWIDRGPPAGRNRGSRTLRSQWGVSFKLWRGLFFNPQYIKRNE